MCAVSERLTRSFRCCFVCHALGCFKVLRLALVLATKQQAPTLQQALAASETCDSEGTGDGMDNERGVEGRCKPTKRPRGGVTTSGGITDDGGSDGCGRGSSGGRSSSIAWLRIGPRHVGCLQVCALADPAPGSAAFAALARLAELVVLAADEACRLSVVRGIVGAGLGMEAISSVLVRGSSFMTARTALALAASPALSSAPDFAASSVASATAANDDDPNENPLRLLLAPTRFELALLFGAVRACSDGDTTACGAGSSALNAAVGSAVLSAVVAALAHALSQGGEATAAAATKQGSASASSGGSFSAAARAAAPASTAVTAPPLARCCLQLAGLAAATLVLHDPRALGRSFAALGSALAESGEGSAHALGALRLMELLARLGAMHDGSTSTCAMLAAEGAAASVAGLVAVTVAALREDLSSAAAAGFAPLTAAQARTEGGLVAPQPPPQGGGRRGGLREPPAWPLAHAAARGVAHSRLEANGFFAGGHAWGWLAATVGAAVGRARAIDRKQAAACAGRLMRAVPMPPMPSPVAARGSAEVWKMLRAAAVGGREARSGEAGGSLGRSPGAMGDWEGGIDDDWDCAADDRPAERGDATADFLRGQVNNDDDGGDDEYEHGGSPADAGVVAVFFALDLAQRPAPIPGSGGDGGGCSDLVLREATALLQASADALARSLGHNAECNAEGLGAREAPHAAGAAASVAGGGAAGVDRGDRWPVLLRGASADLRASLAAVHAAAALIHARSPGAVAAAASASAAFKAAGDGGSAAEAAPAPVSGAALVKALCAGLAASHACLRAAAAGLVYHAHLEGNAATDTTSTASSCTSSTTSSITSRTTAASGTEASESTRSFARAAAEAVGVARLHGCLFASGALGAAATSAVSAAKARAALTLAGLPRSGCAAAVLRGLEATSGGAQDEDEALFAAASHGSSVASERLLPLPRGLGACCGSECVLSLSVFLKYASALGALVNICFSHEAPFAQFPLSLLSGVGRKGEANVLGALLLARGRGVRRNITDGSARAAEGSDLAVDDVVAAKRCLGALVRAACAVAASGAWWQASVPHAGKQALQAAAAAVAADGLCAFARPAEMVTCSENDTATAHMHLFERAVRLCF